MTGTWSQIAQIQVGAVPPTSLVPTTVAVSSNNQDITFSGGIGLITQAGGGGNDGVHFPPHNHLGLTCSVTVHRIWSSS